MKKTLLILIIAALMCGLFSCGGSGSTTSTTPKVTTTAPIAKDPVPTLSELTEALDAAAATRARITLTSQHKDPGGELHTDCYLLFSRDALYYYYEAEYFLPLSEALESNTVIGKQNGHLLLEGDSIVAASDEIDNALLNDLRNYSIRKPNLRAGLFESYTIHSEGELVTLSGRVADKNVTMMYDDALDGARDLAITVTFRKDGLTPIALSAEMIAKDGTPVRYCATYSYEPASLPTKETAGTPDLSLWE